MLGDKDLREVQADEVGSLFLVGQAKTGGPPLLVSLVQLRRQQGQREPGRKKEGLAQKAKKIWKQLSKWGKEFGLDEWMWLKDFCELQKEIKAMCLLRNNLENCVDHINQLVLRLEAQSTEIIVIKKK